MSELVRLSGVPGPTIKHYIRLGLLPKPERTSRNMAYYDPSLVPRIHTIRELQRDRFLPLPVIRDVLERADRGLALPDAIELALGRSDSDVKTRAELLKAGVPAEQLGFFESLGLVTQTEVDGVEGYRGDDLALLRILGAARRAGLSADMLPYTMLAPYMEAVRELARLEMELFQEGVMPNLESDALPAMVATASELSERLLVVLRRKMLRALADKQRRDSVPPEMIDE